MSLIEVGRIDSFDVDEHAEAISPWQVRLTQLSPGRFRARMDFVRTEPVIVYRERWNRKVSVCGESPAGYVMVGTTASPSAQVSWSGVDISERRLACSKPGGDVDFSFSECADHVAALVRSDLLARYLGEAETGHAAFGRTLDCPPEMGRGLIHALASIVARHARRPDLLDDAGPCDALESEVLGALAGCARLGASPGDDPPRRREALRCAVAHAESRVGPISVPELAEAAGVGQRTLEYAFREGLGITPVQFLRRSRLNGAHRELRAAPPGATTVTAVALKWGFNDAGRFAVDHRRMFGVLPSQTLTQPAAPIRRLQPSRPVRALGLLS